MIKSMLCHFTQQECVNSNNVQQLRSYKSHRQELMSQLVKTVLPCD